MRQALPLRGDWNVERVSEKNSNFHQLLKLRAQEKQRSLSKWLWKRDDKYTSPEIQNEMLEALRQISANIQNATFFTMVADETADFSNKEQLVICIRWVDDCFVKNEDFIGTHPLEGTNTRVATVLEILESPGIGGKNSRPWKVLEFGSWSLKTLE